MKNPNSRYTLRACLLTALLLAVGAVGQSAESPTLKSAYQGRFQVGTAINRNIATGTAGRRTPGGLPGPRAATAWVSLAAPNAPNFDGAVGPGGTVTSTFV